MEKKTQRNTKRREVNKVLICERLAPRMELRLHDSIDENLNEKLCPNKKPYNFLLRERIKLRRTERYIVNSTLLSKFKIEPALAKEIFTVKYLFLDIRNCVFNAGLTGSKNFLRIMSKAFCFVTEQVYIIRCTLGPKDITRILICCGLIKKFHITECNIPIQTSVSQNYTVSNNKLKRVKFSYCKLAGKEETKETALVLFNNILELFLNSPFKNTLKTFFYHCRHPIFTNFTLPGTVESCYKVHDSAPNFVKLKMNV
ncbi:unnamed protein product [Moneuplotes crassus]|uniref:Uncharacterized protein n=1 Tax=Euplotes crassus TaxID=5936 RepID=A0AAD1UR66_EUPCR|nr:unnamed protein product [Moneuplotes crassus]